MHAFVTILRFATYYVVSEHVSLLLTMRMPCRHGSYGEFALAHSKEWMDEEDPEMTIVSQAQAWKAAMDYVSAAPELNYLTTIVCRVFETRSKQGSRLLSCVTCAIWIASLLASFT